MQFLCKENLTYLSGVFFGLIGQKVNNFSWFHILIVMVVIFFGMWIMINIFPREVKRND